MTPINYKEQLLRLREGINNFKLDIGMSNAFNDIDRAKKDIQLKTLKDMYSLVNLALNGKIPKQGNPQIVDRAINNIITVNKILDKRRKGKGEKS